jgi:hypothetical protein
MDDKQKTLSLITDAVKKQINCLQSQKITGNINLTLVLSMSQGYIGAVKIRNTSEETVFQSK